MYVWGDNLNNRKKQRNRKIILIITVTIIVFSSISLIFSRTQWGIERMISDTVAVVVYYVIKKTIEFISNLFNEYKELKDVYDENKILREQLAAYASVEVNTNVLSNEIDDLKKQLEELKCFRSNLRPKEKQIKDSDIESIKELRTQGLSYREISQQTSWSKATVCRVSNGVYD